ncbi:ankyrin repeat domain-containing protein 39 [Electrophorus electricus]|uniref:Ankyrin repeat domain 39 n=1 Tax=Electrophorus electricus TaxID=8005 RepID=A0A4W4DR11_ELEEL|nr:ankyrin repeat domain-containing protein 39 [Electrophorus electricus]
MDPHGVHRSCGGRCFSAPGARQTLAEMDFGRGLWSAALDGDLERIGLVLKKGTDPDIRDQTGYTALHYASRAGHLPVCELLLAHGACTNSRTHGGATPLHRAAYCGRLAVARLLLDHGADPSLADDDGSTPLHKAAEQSHLEVCELIVSSCPALRAQKDKRLRLPVDLCPDHSALLELLKPA